MSFRRCQMQLYGESERRWEKMEASTKEKECKQKKTIFHTSHWDLRKVEYYLIKPGLAENSICITLGIETLDKHNIIHTN